MRESISEGICVCAASHRNLSLGCCASTICSVVQFSFQSAIKKPVNVRAAMRTVKLEFEASHVLHRNMGYTQ